MSSFQKNLNALAKQYTQKHIAINTGFSQASINNYLTKNSEPSIQFLIALKKAYGICIDDFLFGDINLVKDVNYDKYLGNFMVYYYNNNSYKGEVHTNLANTLNYGVISIVKDVTGKVKVFGTFVKNKMVASELLMGVNNLQDITKIEQLHKEYNNFYCGELHTNEQSIFLSLYNDDNGDKAYAIFNNPPTYSNYIGGVGTINTIARGREHNPCVQYIIISKKLIDKPDGEIYECLKFNDYHINLSNDIKEIVDLFKRLYVEQNDISSVLTENQKAAIVQNKLEYHLNEILEANVFRFAKISNREDDLIYKLIREGVDVWSNR